MMHGERIKARNDPTLDPLEQIAQQDPRGFPEIIYDLPQGFVSLDVASKGLEKVLGFLFWETNIAIYDSEDVTVFQTDVKNSSFIVIHNNEYYVNEEMFKDVADYAMDIFEQRNRIYNIGDIIEIRGKVANDGKYNFDEHYSLIITSVVKNNTQEGTIYDIKFKIDLSVDEHIK